MDVLLLSLGAQIQGDATVKGFEGQIEVLSFAHGISQPILHGLVGRSAAGRPAHQEFTVTKHLDAATTGIISACDHGTVIPQAIFTLIHEASSDATPLWIITLKQVLISSITFGGDGGSRPTESLTLNYTAIDWLYNGRLNASGEPMPESTSWNLATNTEDV